MKGGMTIPDIRNLDPGIYMFWLMAIAIDFVFINDDDLSRQIKNDFSPQVMQGGPLPVLNGVITPVSRIYHTSWPQLPIYTTSYRSYNSTYN